MRILKSYTVGTNTYIIKTGDVCSLCGTRSPERCQKIIIVWCVWLSIRLKVGSVIVGAV